MARNARAGGRRWLRRRRPAPLPTPQAPGADWKAFLTRHGALLALALLLLFNLAVTPNFATWQTLNVNLTQVCAIVIVGVGMTLVIATGGIDLSVGSLMAIAGALAPLIFLEKLFPLPHPTVGVALAFVSRAGRGRFGWFNGWLVTRFASSPIIATLVLFIAGRGIAQVIDQRQPPGLQEPGVPVHRPRPRVRHPLPGRAHGGRGAAAAWMLRRTVFGRQILAVGGNERAARLAGVPGRRA
jgi:ribose transport system permease protein